MPIPGPAADTTGLASLVPAGSPFWLGLNGEWVLVEGIVPTATIAIERARSEVVSIDGHRYSQQAPLARRQWDAQLPYATPYAVAALRIAADTDSDVWWYAESTMNMLAPRDCYGTVLPALDCAGQPLAVFAGGEVITTRVRGGVPVTLSAWSTRATGSNSVTVTYPGGTAAISNQAYPDLGSVTFTPTADGDATITIVDGAWETTGLMLTEATEPLPVFVAGEAMPCKVTVLDPADVLRMHHAGAWRHEYGVSLREVG